MGAAAGFDTDETGWQIREERQNLMAFEQFADHGLAPRINGMDLDYLFGNIEADGGKVKAPMWHGSAG